MLIAAFVVSVDVGKQAHVNLQAALSGIMGSLLHNAHARSDTPKLKQRATGYGNEKTAPWLYYLKREWLL